MTWLRQRQANADKLRETIDVAEQKISDRDDAGADHHQPAPAVTVYQGSDQRRDAGGDDAFAGTKQGKHAARDAEIGGEWL